MGYILYCHTGSGNHGCEALVRTTAALLKESVSLYSTGYEEDMQYGIDRVVELNKDEIRKLSHRSIEYLVSAIQIKLTHSTQLYTRFSRKAFLSQVAPNDICLSIGGDNYCYSGIETLGDLNRLLQKKGAKTVLWGCSIDPEVLTPSVVGDLKQYDLITVRDPLTMNALKKVGVYENVRKISDPAFLLDIQKAQLPAGFVPGNTIGLNLSPLVLNYTQCREEVLLAFYRLIQEILDTTDSTIALIPHVIKDGNSDLEILEPIYQHFRNTNRVILVPDQNCMQLKYIISKCRLFIGARTHATIAAYSTFVPTIVIGYSVKSKGIAKDLFGTAERYVIPIQQIHTVDILLSAIHWLMENEINIRNHLKKVIPMYQNEAKIAQKYLLELGI